MQTYFYQLSDLLQSRLSGSEMFTVSFAGETSNFVRFNKAKVRQPGTITQQSVSIRLIEDGRHASISVDLSGSLEKDTVLLENVLTKLRERLPYLPQDPHLLINQTVSSSERIDPNQLIPAADMVDQISTSCSGLDMVGILASGSLCFGFSNSLGQRNWFSTSNFNLDWSLVYSTDKAVKSTYAGREWSNAGFASKMEMARKKLQALAKPAKKLQPGQYRVFLTPEALWEILSLMN
ncbi:MAG: TldE/PmbA family protein, partial [Myxococcota bacterium]|nr:TldE/PmbA family protein [Myxococcota bacterium]